jgi:hypothetical protein
MKRMVSLAPALAVMLVVAACSKDGASKDALPEVPPESVPVLAMVELPSGRSLGSAAAVIDGVQPGASAQAADAIPSMLISAVGVSSLDGADLDKPVRAVVLDPKKHPQPVVLLVTVKDATALGQAVTKEKLVVRNELGLIGAPEAIKAAHDYAFGTLARRETPGGPYAVAYLAPILTSFRAEIDAGKMQIGALMTMMSGGAGGEMLGKMLALYIDGVVAMAEQTERIEARFAGQDALSGVELTMHARPDTTFAGFCKAQEADDFALVTMLPANEAPPLIMAGRMALGPARKPFVAFGEAVIATLWSNAINEETRGMIDAWLDLFTGRFAAEVTAIGVTPEMVQLVESTDGAKAADFSRQFMTSLTAKGATMEVMGMKQTVTFVPEAFAHDGVSVMAQKVDTAMPAQADPAADPAADQAAPAVAAPVTTTSYFAGIDDFLGLATGSEQRMRQLIDAVRNKGPRLAPAGALAQALTATKGRKDSVVMFLSFGALLGAAETGGPQSMVMSLGFDEARMRIFVAASR